MNYELCDRAIQEINRKDLRWFNGLKLLKFDELNVFRSVKKVYGSSVSLCRKRYLEIARDAYRRTGCNPDDITEDWILDMLEDYNPTTLYQFTSEVERKQERTAEAILASPQKNREIDKALRLWTRQASHYANECVVRGTVDGYKKLGVKQVKWVARDDEKTCQECYERDGKVYDIDDIPPRHYSCRCDLIPV